MDIISYSSTCIIISSPSIALRWEFTLDLVNFFGLRLRWLDTRLHRLRAPSSLVALILVSPVCLVSALVPDYVKSLKISIGVLVIGFDLPRYIRLIYLIQVSDIGATWRSIAWVI